MFSKLSNRVFKILDHVFFSFFAASFHDVLTIYLVIAIHLKEKKKNSTIKDSSHSNTIALTTTAQNNNSTNKKRKNTNI